MRKELVCGFCERAFSRIDSLRRHIRNVHGANPMLSQNDSVIAEIQEATPSSSEAKEFSCEVCGNLYSRLDNLNRHKKRSHPVDLESSMQIVRFLVCVVRAVLTFTRPISDKILDVFCTIVYGRSKPLPCIDNKILLMSATELAKKIRKKELSAVDVMQAYINRIKAVQPIINACIDCRFEEAIADARAVDKMLEAGIKMEAELADEMPLLGVPFSCKEIIGVKNFLSTFGLKQFKDRVAPEDSDAAALYKQAGAIPVVVTNIPTMCMWWDTHSIAFGQTKNPYDNNRSPGGSSGGEAALISSAGSVIGIGNDLGGSIRVPASFCGIYGHKSSRGAISNKTSYPGNAELGKAVANIDKINSTGPLCRYAQDLQLLVKVLSNNNKKLQLDKPVDFKTLKVYYIEELPGSLLAATSDIKASVLKAVKHFEDEYGIAAEKLKMKELKYATEIWLCKAFEAAGAFVNASVFGADAKPNYFWEFLKCTFGWSDYDYRILYFALIEPHKKDKFYYKCLEKYSNIEEKLDEILDDNAVLVMPISPEPAPHPIVTIPKFYNVAYTCIFNILGLPGTAVPAGLSNGLPIGLQILAKRDCDHLTLAAAVELDKVFGGWRNPCPVLI